jgi:CRP/FNR family transcriptional regulator, cyclic AMP receptor protein
MSSSIDANTVKNFAPFAKLTPDEAALVAQLLELQVLARGETLFHQGDASETIYLIISGEMEILLQVPNHDDHHLVTLGPGTIFGEVAPLADERRTATATAVSEVNLARLAWSALESGLEHGDRWAVKFLFHTSQVLARRLRAVNDQFAATLAKIDTKSLPNPAHTEDELDSLRRRLLRDWSF